MTAINFSLSEEIWQEQVAYEAELSKSGLIFTTDSFIYIHSFFGFFNLAILSPLKVLHFGKPN